MYLRPVPLTIEEVADYYEGFSNDTLWPIYHDVIVPATFHRYWWTAYERVNRRFAEAICEVAAMNRIVPDMRAVEIKISGTSESGMVR